MWRQRITVGLEPGNRPGKQKVEDLPASVLEKLVLNGPSADDHTECMPGITLLDNVLPGRERLLGDPEGRNDGAPDIRQRRT